MASTLLPTIEQVRAATLIDVHYDSTPATTIPSDPATTPAQCALAATPVSQSGWGAAVSTASQRFGEGPDEAHPANFVDVAIGVFPTADDAFDSFSKVIASVHSCTGYTQPDTSPVGRSPARTLSDVHAGGERRLLWTDNDSDAPSPWKCVRTYRAQTNLAAFVITCGPNPSDGAAKLADQIVTSATKK